MVKEDIEQINEIDHEAFPTQWPPSNYQQELNNKIAFYLVAYDDTRAVDGKPGLPKKQSGFFARLFSQKNRHPNSESLPPEQRYLVGFSGIWMLAGEAHVTNLAVRREYRGKGLGELLLIATVDLATDLKASFMTLEVRTSNLVAQKLYSKYGFVEMGMRRGYYLDNHEDAIIMSTDMLDAPAFQAHIRELREALKKKLA